MKASVCKDCVYSKYLSVEDRYKVCTKYNNIKTSKVEKCPMGYGESDIEWVITKTEEDKLRGHALYTAVQ